jgi:hypothetical protein
VEPLQIVSYTKGQYFRVHHDAGTLDEDTGTVEVVLPRRVITIFVYINTVPEVQYIVQYVLCVICNNIILHRVQEVKHVSRMLTYQFDHNEGARYCFATLHQMALQTQ